MRTPHSATVVGKDGLTGVLESQPHPDSNEPVRIRLDGGPVIEVPGSMLRHETDGAYSIPIGPAELEHARSRRDADGGDAVIPVLAEELVVAKEAVPTGGVRVHRRTLEHDETVDVPLMKEHVDVRRVLVDREVDGPLPVRRDGDTTIIPIVEEVLVIDKRFRLKEEIHVTRTVREERHREQVTVHRQEAEVEKLDAGGRPMPVEIPPAREERLVREERPARRFARKSILRNK